MKKALWEELSIGSAVPSNAYPSKAIFFFCSQQGSSIDVAETNSNSAVKLPWLLSVLIVVSFSFPRLSQERVHQYFVLNRSISKKVPLYLRLGQLIYYS